MKKVARNLAMAASIVSAWAATVSAQTGLCVDVDSCRVATDRPAAVLIYPKIEVDPAAGIDTVVQLANTSDGPVSVRCNFLNANGHCSDDDSVCRVDSDCGSLARCVQGWSETDFRVTLTRLQPLSWNASRGLTFLPCDFNSPSGAGCAQRNDGRVPPVPEERFIGEMRCIEVDDSDAPVDFNDLVGEATVIRAAGDALDAEKYNAIGVQAIPGANDHDNNLCLGGDSASDDCPNGAEYAGCPQTLMADHFFEGAAPASAPVSSRLTLVPCGEDLLNSNVIPSMTVQLLVFNEFEQRTSTSFRLRCFSSQPLADVDTSDGPADDQSSIFSVTTQGTLAGQTRINAVSSTTAANGVVGILEESQPCDNGPDSVCNSSVNLHQQGRRSRSDILRIP